ncbi:uncharacterized protein LOC133907802 isoform X2 [Phragmites australis]|uniref:uncharacterized protein LOC133907802 isoform X2 n=1 Tax=Phragmites australis TaxID=29695 RepID=UPI002D77F5EE|nr:uncharacterized protein LOC133907802 isoform X2 [Phragmites australis]
MKKMVCRFLAMVFSCFKPNPLSQQDTISVNESISDQGTGRSSNLMCLLADEVLIEIFLRLPPHPSCILRASIVCKHWRHLITSTLFLRCFHEFHQMPPLLGFFTNSTRIPHFLPYGDTPNRVIAAAFSLPDPYWQVLCCRHSHVILVNSIWTRILVWDPMTGEKRFVSMPNLTIEPGSQVAVFCRAGHNDHSCPFFIVWVYTIGITAYAREYSSERGTWNLFKISSVPFGSKVDSRPSVLVGNVLYWLLKPNHILAFDCGTRKLHCIECPPETNDICRRNVHVMKVEDGGLGLIAVMQFGLLLWARETNAEGAPSWVLRKVIDLDAYLPVAVAALPSTDNHTTRRPAVMILGIIEDDDVVFLWMISGVFAVQLNSMHFKKIFESDVSVAIFPYKSFYIAEMLGSDSGKGFVGH